MDQDSASSESRERCPSSEPPSSTRPNPFGDGADLSARKRRRTSKELQDDLTAAPPAGDDAIADGGKMKLDSPEPDTPSTPARPAPTPAEPVSSKVTLNLRKGNSQGATPDSPPSPTPTRFQSDHVRASIEASEVDMAETVAAEASKSTVQPGNPDAAIVLIEDDEEEDEGDDSSPELVQVADPEVFLSPEQKHRLLVDTVCSFPYSSPEEGFFDTLGRLNNFFQQPASNVDDALEQLEIWFRQVLAVADADTIPLLRQIYHEQRAFFLNMPELFVAIYRRCAYSKSPETRQRYIQLMQQFYKFAALLVSVDYEMMSSSVAADEPADLDLIAPVYLHIVGWITRREQEELQPAITNEVVEELGLFMDAFQSLPGGSMSLINQYAELLEAHLSKTPRKTAEYLYKVSHIVESLVRYSHTAMPYGGRKEFTDRLNHNLAAGFQYFKSASAILATSVEKFTNHLSPEATVGLINNLTDIYKLSLQKECPGAIEILRAHQKETPDVLPQFTSEAVALEWRFDVLAKLVRSRQMQLRVSAVSCMCSDLVFQWKQYSDREKVENEETPRLLFLRHLSRSLIGTGIVDYVLGPTCHPEITLESANVVGFLMVTRTYTPDRTDLWWQTATKTQDPRITDALVRMMNKILSLCEFEHVAYLCDKLANLPVDGFNISMRELLENVGRQYIHKLSANGHELSVSDLVPHELCIRLMQESSVYGPQCTIAFPDIQGFAQRSLAELIKFGVPDTARRHLALVCLQDVASKSRSTPGSMQALGILAPAHAQVQWLVTEHDFARLLIEELDSSIKIANEVGFRPVFSHPDCSARRRHVSIIVGVFGSTIDPVLGQRLWDRLVGHGAACQEDRRIAWEDLTTALRRARYHHAKPIRTLGGFLADCFGQFLPQLHPTCYCLGTLDFVREDLLPQVNDPNSTLLGDDAQPEAHDLELLWQMVLTSPPNTIEERAIYTLVHDIYVDSQLIKTLPLSRARKVHFSLVARCFQQLKTAAQKLQSYSDGFASGDDDSMVIVSTEDQQQQQELHFVRSLKVLNALLRALQGRSHFTAADLRPLMLPTPSPPDGERIDLKFQPFDGDAQGDIKTLQIGMENTVASLLTSLRDASGFDNFRLYFRGRPFNPTDTDACKTIGEASMGSGLVLIKREISDAPSSPRRIKPGASSLDIEILSHFKDLWDFLSLDEKLASEIYGFLIRLPADDSILAIFEDPSTVHRDVFPPGQPFKSLYALHALKEYMNTRRVRQNMIQSPALGSITNPQPEKDQAGAGTLTKVTSWIVAAICDPDIAGKGSSENLQQLLLYNFVNSLVQLLKESTDAEPLAALLTVKLQKRLLDVTALAANAHTAPASEDLINRAYEALLESSVKSEESWLFLRSRSEEMQALTQALLLLDDRPSVRQGISKLIVGKSAYSYGSSVIRPIDFAEYFWGVVSHLLPRAAQEPSKCEETFRISLQLLKKLFEAESSALDLPACVASSGALILSHTSTEEVSSTESVDVAAHCLVSILYNSIRYLGEGAGQVQFGPGLARKLYAKHLFPPQTDDGRLVQPVIVSASSRSMLYDIIFMLVKGDPRSCVRLLQDMASLTRYVTDHEDDPYVIDLPQAFDRTRAIRAPCGYAGLRNLSNTCYLNSLFTQLFMNVEFRQFILECPVPESEVNQLLGETQSLFAHLQDSRRRFIDPQHCVAQITTYEETAIDIHNQMDVDEFYSLLFDRWEAQMPTPAAKTKLKSIYGGDLVQQVKSQECPHISERVEPFSAIQCDIKGKSCLEESLQAYVDGEIMEGDNKYKCSDCDRHVNAVKRACLKDIPDHLIFHLKRFDFNLRTLQRSKINDYFSFPAKINMQPYTVEHLTDPSRESEPDEFELVGVLVHSGTAESGHYYSFIRERPTTGSAESWVEFNDDAVSPWDPMSMESACFGGQQSEFRQFDGTNVYEKVYSAYMLFYQRSSSLGKQQMALGESAQPGPLRCNLPPTLATQIKDENYLIIQRHCLYDPAHIPFSSRMLSQVWGDECSEEHKVENLAVQVALGHLDQVASRAKETPDFDLLCSLISNVCNRCPKCCIAFFSFFRKAPEALRMLLQKNSDVHVRQDTRRLLSFVLRSIKENFPDEYSFEDADESDDMSVASRQGSTVSDAAVLFLHMFESFHFTLRSWPDYFGAMTEFARLGKSEATAMLEANFLWRTGLMIWADAAIDVPPQYARMLTNISRRSTRPPNFENVIALFDTLLGYMDIDISADRLVEEYQNRLDFGTGLIPFTVDEVNFIHRDWSKNRPNIFVEKLLQLNQNPTKTNSIIVQLMKISPMMETKVLITLRAGITHELVAFVVSPFLSAAAAFCRHSTNQGYVRQLIGHVATQCSKGINNSEGRSFFEFLRDVFEEKRNTGETEEEIETQGLGLMYRWVPGLLGTVDHGTALEIDAFLQEELFEHAHSRAEGESAELRSRAARHAVRRLGVACLQYLRETYVIRRVHAARDTVLPLENIIKYCSSYFDTDDVVPDDGDDGLDAEYRDLCLAVLEPMTRLTVDEIEDDGSDWENSIASSEPVESLADLSMQVDREGM